jgi:NitT/TauT family transport system substrate-binding protein
VLGQNDFLKTLDPAQAARELVDERYVRKAIEAQGGMKVFGAPDGYARTETFEVT